MEKFSNFCEYFKESLLNLLYAITAGIAANKPNAVAKRASAIPGATIAKLVFLEIAISRNTSLAIVAPGIAEALFATALGLLAAIPAVIAYNKFNNDSLKYSQKLENFSKRFLTII